LTNRLNELESRRAVYVRCVFSRSPIREGLPVCLAIGHVPPRDRVCRRSSSEQSRAVHWSLRPFRSAVPQRRQAQTSRRAGAGNVRAELVRLISGGTIGIHAGRVANSDVALCGGACEARRGTEAAGKKLQAQEQPEDETLRSCFRGHAATRC